jgi:citronellol/citronellal dehydrogenase
MIKPLQNKTAFITGATRGIGKAIALELAKLGCNIVVAAKSVVEDPRLGGTIYTAAQEIEALGVKALAVQLDIREEAQIENAINQTIATFGGIDILINNASAINLSKLEQLESKRLDLMLDINVRGTLLMCKHAIPHLQKSSNAHIINLSPPINLNSKWFANHTAYTISKYNMSMIVLGLAAELKSQNIAINALWPQTTIATAAVQNLLGGDQLIKMSRTPQIIADCAAIIVQKPSTTCTGNFFIDEQLLTAEGVTDLSHYAVDATQPLYKDLFVD